MNSFFEVQSSRDNLIKTAQFNQGNLISEEGPIETSKRKGTRVSFTPDEAIFKKYKYRNEYVERMLKNYVYLNLGLTTAHCLKSSRRAFFCCKKKLASTNSGKSPENLSVYFTTSCIF